MTRRLALFVAVAFLSVGSCSVAQLDTKTQGIVKLKPATGRFVAIDGGYMIPYEAKIPGTEVIFTMMPIPGGQFTMGSPADEKHRCNDEGPQFEVIVEPFWMGKHEVTWAEYKTYMELSLAFRKLQKQGLRKVDPDNEIDAVTAPSSLYDPSYSFAEGEGADQPAATMTQFAAKQYTKWLSLISDSFYRLPTEGEWEYACRAGTKTAYYFGDDPGLLSKHAWFDETADEERHAVGQLLPNPWGLHDMHGNVAEWVLDAYREQGYKPVKSGSAITTKRAFNPPTQKHPRGARGGSFESTSEACRSASRLGSDKDWGMEDPNYPKSPWWYTSSPASGVGIRLLRPLQVPDTRDDMNEFWVDDVPLQDARERVEDSGRGAYAPVDPELPQEMQNLKKEDK